MIIVKICLIISCFALAFTSCTDEPVSLNEPGTVIWSIENQNINTVSKQPLIADGVVYFLQDRMLKAYTLDIGKPLWKVQLWEQGPVDYSHNLLIDGELLFIDMGWEIRAYNKENGTPVWQNKVSQTSEEISGNGAPILSQDEDFLYAGRVQEVLKINKLDGRVAMRIPLDSLKPASIRQGSSDPVVSSFGDSDLYIPTAMWDTTLSEPLLRGNLFSFNKHTGEYNWGYSPPLYLTVDKGTENETEIYLPSSIFDIEISEKYVVALGDGAVIAVDRKTGKEAWIKAIPIRRYFDDSYDGFFVGLALDETAVYVVSVGGYAYKLDLATGEIMWTVDVGFSNISIPTVVDGKLYFNVSAGGEIWVIDTDTGKVLFSARPPGYQNDSFDVYISSLGVGEGYMVNVGSKKVYCLVAP